MINNTSGQQLLTSASIAVEWCNIENTSVWIMGINTPSLVKLSTNDMATKWYLNIMINEST